jgi:ADP-ribosylglycohydrolase
MSNGNGSLMRVLPLALYMSHTDDALVHDAHLQSCQPMHTRSLVACAYYCLVARAYLEGNEAPWMTL